MKETRSEIQTKLDASKARLAEMETLGVDALSNWDKHLGDLMYGGH